MTNELRRPRALLLDLDGTLVDGRDMRSAVEATCADLVALGHVPDAALLAKANFEVWAARWSTAEADWMSGRLSGQQLRYEVWAQALRACGCADGAVAELAAMAHLEYSRSSLRLFEDVRPFLEHVAAAMPVGLVTNGAPDDQRWKLQQLGLEAAFRPLLVSGEVGVAKPDAAIFRMALDALGLEAGDVWHVGDSLRHDVAGAQSAGIGAVWLNRRGLSRRGEEPVPDLEISSLEELWVRVLAQ